MPIHQLQDVPAAFPSVVIAQQPENPVHAAITQEPLRQPARGMAGRLLIGIEPHEPANPIVRCIADIRPVQTGRCAAKLNVALEERPVAGVVVQVRIAEPKDADGPVIVDPDRPPHIGSSNGRRLLKAPAALFPDFLNGQIAGRLRCRLAELAAECVSGESGGSSGRADGTVLGDQSRSVKWRHGTPIYRGKAPAAPFQAALAGIAKAADPPECGR